MTILTAAATSIIDEFVEVQELIMNVTAQNITETKEAIMKTSYKDTPSKVFETVKEIFYTARIRKNMHRSLSKLIVELNSSFANTQNKAIDLKEMVLNIALELEKDDQEKFYTKTSDYRLLRFLYEEGLFDINEVELAIEEIPNTHRNQRALLMLFFAPEIHELSLFQSLSNFEFLHESLQEYIKKIDIYAEEGWICYKEYIEKGYESYSFEAALNEDDDDLYTRYAGIAGYSPSKLMPINPFEACPLIQGHNVLDHVAYYGSLKIFKIIFLSGCIFQSPCPCAAAGGNIEIFRILLQKNAGFLNTLPIVTKYRRYDIFRWILDYNMEFENESRLKESYRNSIETNNVQAMADFIQMGVKPETSDIISESTLHTAARAGNSTVFKVLSSINGADINGLDISGNTPLRIAVDNHRHFFVEDNKDSGVEPNCTGSLKFTPLHLAAQRDNLHLVEALLKCKGINVNYKNAFGMTPLSMAKSEKVRQVLLLAGAE